jgi:hypothetical protein
MILFMHSCPWAVKIWTLAIALLSDVLAVHSSNALRYSYVFALVCIATLSSVMPSMAFSMSNRKKTTSYIMQSALYLTAVYTVLDVLLAYSAEHCVLVTYLLLCHFLTAQVSVLQQQPHVLMYSGVIVRVHYFLLALLSLVCLWMCPPVQVHGVSITGMMFLPELLGLLVTAVHSIVKAFGDLFEECMNEDASKYD